MEFIPLARPGINEDDIEAVSAVLRGGMLVQGENVLKLEKAFCDFNKAENAIAVSNGTATMHLVLKVLGIGPGDEVIVPAFSYVATANVVELVGATPVFVDVDLATFNIDCELIEQNITPRTKAIIPVHEFGLACDIERVCAIAKKHNLHVIEDAACALGATQNGKYTGTFGIAGSFSLHPRKSITSGEGGVITTHDADLAKKLRQYRNHGIEMVEGKMDFVEAGFNYRMTDFQGALAYSQMQRLADILSYKTRLSEIYFNEINNPKITLPAVPIGMQHTWQTFHLLIDESLKQDEVIAWLKTNGIGANYGAQCIPSQRYYQNKYRLDSKVLYPNSYKAYTSGVAIPLYERLSKEQVAYIAKKVNEIC